MKKLFTAILFAMCVLTSSAQSAASVLATLHIKGATSEGGEPKYGNYVPRLNGDGCLDVSFMPGNMYTNIYDWVNENGSEHDRQILNSFVDNFNSLLNFSINNLSSNLYVYVDDASYAITNSLSLYESDPVFNRLMFGEGVAIGSGAVVSNGAYQIGCGTNTVSNTLAFFDTVLVDGDGQIPTNTISWAATREDLNAAINNAYATKVSKTGDSMSGLFAYTNASYSVARVAVSNDFPMSASGILVYLPRPSETSVARFTGFIKTDTPASTNLDRRIDYRFVDEDIPYTQGVGYTLYVSSESSVTNNITFKTQTTGDGEVDIVFNGTTYTTALEYVEKVHIDDVFGDLYRHMQTKNPHGITLKDIQEPVDFIEMKTAGGKIFRYYADEDGSLKYKRVK